MTTKHELAGKITALVQQMQEVATEIDYLGGFAEWAQHGAELMNASFTAETWAEGIRAEAQAEQPHAPQPIYCYAASEEGPYQDSEDDVVSDILEEYGRCDVVVIWRGIKTIKHHRDFISFDADNVIEQMQESAFEECGEVADDYLPPLAPGLAESLENHLNKAAAVWFNANIPQPTFWMVENTEEVKIVL